MDQNIIKRAQPLILSFLAGIFMVLLIGFAKNCYNNSNVSCLEGIEGILKIGEFGNVKLIRVDSEQFPLREEQWEKGEALIALMDDIPFLYLKKNTENKIIEIGLWDDERKLLEGIFDDSKFSHLVFFGNEASGGLSVHRSGENNLWTASYFKHDGKGFPASELYVDIDFDGQFDSKELWDKVSPKPLKAYIFIENDWKEMSGVDEEQYVASRFYADGEFISYGETLDLEIRKRIELVPRELMKRVYFDYEPGLGWQRRKNNRN